MASILNDTMATAKTLFGSAKDGAGQAVGTAKSAMDSAREGTGHAVSSARSTLMDSINAVTSIAAALRSFNPNSALGLVGLERRRGPFLSAAIFGAGFVAGAGAGVLLAPMSGAELRKAMLKSWKGLEAELKEVLSRAATEVEGAEDKVEELAGKAKDAVKKAERKVEGKVADGVDALKRTEGKVESKVADGADALKSGAKAKVDTAAGAVKDGLHDAKSMVAAVTDPAHESETAKPARTPGSAGHRAS